MPKENIHEGHRERVKKKFLEHGFSESTPEHEVLEMILFYGISRKDTNELAHNLIDRFGSLFEVLGAPVSELTKVKGVSEHTAILLNLFYDVIELYVKGDPNKKTILHTSDEAGQYLLKRYDFFGNDEVFTMLGLNRLGEMKSFDIVEKGDIASVGVSIRKILEIIMKTNATTVIIAHNHPSGIALPSDADIKITAAIKNALATIGVRLTDHIIIADGDFVSLAQSERFRELFL